MIPIGLPSEFNLFHESDFTFGQAIDGKGRARTRDVIVIGRLEKVRVSHERLPKDVVDLETTATSKLTGNGGDRIQVIVDHVPAIDREH